MDGSSFTLGRPILRVHSVREDGPDFIATTEDGVRVRITQSLGRVEVRETPGDTVGVRVSDPGCGTVGCASGLGGVVPAGGD